MPPWRPGESGNPGGRPRGRSVTSSIREILDGDELDGVPTGDGRTIGELLAAMIVKHAMTGNGTYLKELMERVEGKVPPPRVADDDKGSMKDVQEQMAAYEAQAEGVGPDAGVVPGAE